MQSPKQYLVTGCAGFIGSHVCRRLAEAGHRVLGIDNLNDAYDPQLKRWRLSQLAPLPNFCFQRLDISRPRELTRLFASCANERTDGPPVDAVLNLAARAGVRASVDNPWVYLETNAGGTLNLLEACRQYGIPKFVLSSTSSLYGRHNAVPYREDASTSRPVSPYAASKQSAEAFTYAYHSLHQLDVSVLRYFTVYGPAGRPDMSVFRFIRWIAEGEPLDVYGDGSQRRDFTYIDDIVRGTIAAIRPVGYETINLGSDRPVELRAMISNLEKLLDRPAKLRFHPVHPADVEATWADITKAKRLLDWSPAVTLEEGLAHCVAWYRAHRDWAQHVALDAPSLSIHRPAATTGPHRKAA